jgi:hypothetical protein
MNLEDLSIYKDSEKTTNMEREKKHLMSDKSKQKNKIIHGKYIQSLDAQLNNERDTFLSLTKENLMDTLEVT